MELKFRVYSRSASKKRWNEKWKLKLVSGEEFHVTHQLLKIPAGDDVAPTDIICVFYIQDGSLYFQMRDEHRTAIINGVARPDAVVGKGDRIAIDEFAEILILQAPQASADGPTLTDVGALDEGDGPTLAMEVTSSADSGISVDAPIDIAPGVVGGDAEIPNAPEPTTFMNSNKPEKMKAFDGDPLADDESIPDIAADDRPEMTKAGLRSLLEATKTSAASAPLDDPDKTPPTGIQRPEDLPFESALDPYQAVSDAPQQLREPTRTEALKTRTMAQTKTVLQDTLKNTSSQNTKTATHHTTTKTHVTTSYPLGQKEEKIELENSKFTDGGIDKEITGVYHSPPKVDPTKKKTVLDSDDNRSEITKSLMRIGAKASELTGAITTRLQKFSNTLTGTATRISDEPPSIEPASYTGTITKSPRKPDVDDVTGDGIVVERPRPHPTKLAQEDAGTEERTEKKRALPVKVIFFGGGLSLSIFAFFLVYVLLKPADRTPIVSINKTNPAGTTVIVVNGGQPPSGQAPSPVQGQPAGQIQPGSAQVPGQVQVPGHAQAVAMATARPALPGSGTGSITPPPVFKNPSNPGSQPGGVATVSNQPLPRGIPIEMLIRKVQRLKTPPSSSNAAPESARTIQGSSR